jgi:hypothetical protein
VQAITVLRDLREKSNFGIWHFYMACDISFESPWKTELNDDDCTRLARAAGARAAREYQKMAKMRGEAPKMIQKWGEAPEYVYISEVMISRARLARA